MSAPLIIAIPSKGRLQDNTSAFFERAGLVVERPGGARNYRGQFRGVDNIEIAFLSASEISSELAAGAVHLGITGLDLVHERTHFRAPAGRCDFRQYGPRRTGGRGGADRRPEGREIVCRRSRRL